MLILEGQNNDSNLTVPVKQTTRQVLSLKRLSRPMRLSQLNTQSRMNPREYLCLKLYSLV